MANDVRTTKLATNKRAGLLVAATREVVHHSPPKNTVPMARPAKRDKVTANISAMLTVVIFFVLLTNFPVFTRNPAPYIQTTDCQPGG